MEDNAKTIETLIERITDFSKTSYDLARLKALDKSSDILSSLIPHSIVFILFTSFLLFANFGLAYWLGDILGNNYYGFFLVAAFYVSLGLILHFFFHKKIKNMIWNYIIKQVLK